MHYYEWLEETTVDALTHAGWQKLQYCWTISVKLVQQNEMAVSYLTRICSAETFDHILLRCVLRKIWPTSVIGHKWNFSFKPMMYCTYPPSLLGAAISCFDLAKTDNSKFITYTFHTCLLKINFDIVFTIQ